MAEDWSHALQALGVSLRVAALSDVDYGRFIATLRESAEPIMRA